MNKKRLFFLLLSLMMVVLLLAPDLAEIAHMADGHHHDHTGETCTICQQIASLVAGRQKLVQSPQTLSLVAALYAILWVLGVMKESYCVETLVSLNIKLSN